MWLLASSGPFTAVLEALASSIGAGLVVGGFAGGLGSFLTGRSRSESEREALKVGYVTGAVGLLLLAVDTMAKHFV